MVVPGFNVNFLRGASTAAAPVSSTPLSLQASLQPSPTAPSTPTDEYSVTSFLLLNSPPRSRRQSPNSLRPVTSVGSGATTTTATSHSNAVASLRPQVPSNTATNASASDMLRAVAGQRYDGSCSRFWYSFGFWDDLLFK